jgi:hypothetical protein
VNVAVLVSAGALFHGGVSPEDCPPLTMLVLQDRVDPAAGAKVRDYGRLTGGATRSCR